MLQVIALQGHLERYSDCVTASDWPKDRQMNRRDGPTGKLWRAGLVELVDDEAGAELGLKPCGLGGHDVSGVGDVHELLH